jgi:hypothetical protein
MNYLSLLGGAGGGLGVLILGFLVVFFKNKAGAAAEIAKIVTQDAPLAAKQAEIEDKIKSVENQDDSKLTPEERAARWSK